MTDCREALLVRIEQATGGAAVTIPCPSDLQFSRDAIGGYKSLSCTLTVPPGTPAPPALAVYSHVRVVDRRTGATVWYGQLTDPGLSIDAGQTYSLTAEGAQIAADGWREVYGLVDRAAESWQAVGDFKAGSPEISGDFDPNLDLNFDWDVTLPDLNLDFPGWDAFPGIDYPPNADYPGYLGWESDPFAGIGGSGESNYLPRWVPGTTGSVAGGTGNSATVTVTGGWGRFTSGTVANGRTNRRDEATSCMAIPGPALYDGAGFYLGNLYRIASVIFRFKLGTSANLEVWTYADTTLGQSGFVLRAGTGGTVTWYQANGGTLTSVASASLALTAGTDYECRVSAFGQAAIVPAGTITPGSIQDLNWTSYYNDVDWTSGTYDAGLLTTWLNEDAARWAGVGVLGDGTTTSRQLDVKAWVVRRYSPYLIE